MCKKLLYLIRVHESTKLCSWNVIWMQNHIHQDIYVLLRESRKRKFEKPQEPLICGRSESDRYYHELRKYDDQIPNYLLPKTKIENPVKYVWKPYLCFAENMAEVMQNHRQTVTKFEEILLPKIPKNTSKLIQPNRPKYLG